MFPRNFDVVEQGAVYRSGRLNAHTAVPTLRKYHIGTAVSLLSDNDQPEEARPMVAALETCGVHRAIVPMNGTGIATADAYAKVLEAIVQAKAQKSPVLVHCSSGAQRTGGTIAAYELLVLHRDPDAVEAELLAHGHLPRRNPGLVPWLNATLPTIAQRLVSDGILKEMPDPVPQLRAPK